MNEVARDALADSLRACEGQLEWEEKRVLAAQEELTNATARRDMCQVKVDALKAAIASMEVTP